MKCASPFERFKVEPFNSRGSFFGTRRLITASGFELETVQIHFAQIKKQHKRHTHAQTITNGSILREKSRTFCAKNSVWIQLRSAPDTLGRCILTLRHGTEAAVSARPSSMTTPRFGTRAHEISSLVPGPASLNLESVRRFWKRL